MAGSIEVTRNDEGPQEEITVVWTSDADGNVSGTTVSIRSGFLYQAHFIPSAADAPSDAYDLTLLDPDGIDVLIEDDASVGTNLSNTTNTRTTFTSIPFLPEGEYEPNISGAGN